MNFTLSNVTINFTNNVLYNNKIVKKINLQLVTYMLKIQEAIACNA